MSLRFQSFTEYEEDDVEYNKICDEHKHLLETLPKGSGWRVQHLYNYNGFWLNEMFLKANLLVHAYFKPEPTDVVLASFMKSGTTWLKALMFSTLNRDQYSFSNHFLHNNHPRSTIPFLGMESYPMTDSTTFSAPRLFITHFARTLLPACMSSCKFVYVCRDPKDVLVSKWHFMCKLRSKGLLPFHLTRRLSFSASGCRNSGRSGNMYCRIGEPAWNLRTRFCS
ncbi:hypothetical protein R6Q59_018197 [Mikania micrantha]